MSGSKLIETINHCKRNIERIQPPEKDAKKISHYLDKLLKLPVTLKELEETGIGRTVNNLRKCADTGVKEESLLLVAKWKQVVQNQILKEEQSAEMKVPKKEKSHDGKQHHDSTKKDEKRKMEKRRSKEEEKASKRKREKEERDKKDKKRKKEEKIKVRNSSSDEEEMAIDEGLHRSDSDDGNNSVSPSNGWNKSSVTASESSMASPVELAKKKASPAQPDSGKKYPDYFPESAHPLNLLSDKVKLKPLESKYIFEGGASCVPSSSGGRSNSGRNVAMLSSLPSSSSSFKSVPHKLKEGESSSSASDALESVMRTKNHKTKVFSGVKRNELSSVPTLIEICTKVIYENFNALEDTGGVPFYILKPILEKVSADALYKFECYNSYMIGETDDLWKVHAKRDFKNGQLEEYESWRDFYMRCVEERNDKLASLTAQVKNSMKNSQPVRKTQCIGNGKPPRNIAKIQAKNGTGYGITSSSGSSNSFLVAKKPSTGLQPDEGAVKARLAKEMAITPSSSSTSPPPDHKTYPLLKKKPAPLMQKTLRLMKGIKGKR